MTRPIGAPTYRCHATDPDVKGQTARETVASEPEPAQTAPQAPPARRMQPQDCTKDFGCLDGRRMPAWDGHKIIA